MVSGGALPVLTPAAFRAQIAKGATDPVYLVIGDDDHEKSSLALAVGEMIEEDLRAFNVERLYAVDGAVTPRSVAEAAQTLPMIAPRRIVIVLQAEKLFDQKKRRKADAVDGGDDDESAGSLEPLVAYLEDPSPTTTLLFVFSIAENAKSPEEIPLAKNLKVTKTLLKAASVVVCTGLDGGKDAGAWVEQQARAAGLAIERPVVARLLQLSANDTARLRADVQKLLLFAAGKGTVTLDDLATVSGAPEHHGDDWALVRAIEQGDAATALRELGAALSAGGIPFQILGQIGYAVRTPPPRGRFPARRVPQAVNALLRTDLALKSSGGDPRALLERLVVDLCG